MARNENELEINLFSALLKYRPRDERGSGENFLTESLAYIIRVNKRYQTKFIELVTEGKIGGARIETIVTQAQFEDNESRDRSIPDICIAGRDSDGTKFQLWLENKWGSKLSAPQLQKYAKNLLKGKSATERAHLTFISAIPKDVREAEKVQLPSGVGRSSLRWNEVYSLIRSFNSKERLTIEFYEFMKAHGLGGIDEVTLSDAIAYEKQRRTRVEKKSIGKSNPFRRKLEALGNAILAELESGDDFSRLPYPPRIEDAYGRISIMCDGRNGENDSRASIGFLYDPIDHRTAFLNPKRPLDLCLRIQANPEGPMRVEIARESIASVLTRKLKALGYECNPNQDKWRENRHTVLLAQFREGFPWDSTTGRAQVDRLLPIFRKTLLVLFKEQEIRKRIMKLNPY